MKVLITGATGFIGTNLQRYFIQHNINFETVSLRGDYKTCVNNDITAVIHLAGKAHDLKKTVSENEYYNVNTKLTEQIYQDFCKSNAKIFIYLSSVKAVEDKPINIIDENTNPYPRTAYGKSKLAAEVYLNSKRVLGKQLFILRPAMVYGPNNKGNLNLLYNLIRSGIPYPLGKYENRRSYLYVENLCYIIQELLTKDKILSDTFMLADDEALSTNEIVKLIGNSLDQQVKSLRIPYFLINFISRIGDIFNLPFNSHNLDKLTENYEVSNAKIKKILKTDLPFSTKDGLMRTFDFFRLSNKGKFCF